MDFGPSTTESGLSTTGRAMQDTIVSRSDWEGLRGPQITDPLVHIELEPLMHWLGTFP